MTALAHNFSLSIFGSFAVKAGLSICPSEALFTSCDKCVTDSMIIGGRASFRGEPNFISSFGLGLRVDWGQGSHCVWPAICAFSITKCICSWVPK